MNLIRSVAFVKIILKLCHASQISLAIKEKWNSNVRYRMTICKQNNFFALISDADRSCRKNIAFHANKVVKFAYMLAAMET